MKTARTLLTLALVLTVSIPVAVHAKKDDAIEIKDIALVVTTVEQTRLDKGRMVLRLGAIGDGTIDCRDNQACIDRNLHGRTVAIRQEFIVGLDIDHSSVGIKARTSLGLSTDDLFGQGGLQYSVKGSGSSDPPVCNAGLCDLSLSVEARTKNDGRVVQTITGTLDRDTGRFVSLWVALAAASMWNYDFGFGI